MPPLFFNCCVSFFKVLLRERNFGKPFKNAAAELASKFLDCFIMKKAIYSRGYFGGQKRTDFFNPYNVVLHLPT